jgi:adenylate cyclase class 2
MPAAPAHEVEVKYSVCDRQALLAALASRGVHLGSPVEQDDRHGSLSLCLDDVTGIGCFFEVESLAEAGSAGLGRQAELHQVVDDLGVPLERTTTTYDSLIRDAQLASA